MFTSLVSCTSPKALLSQVKFQMEQGLPVLPKFLIFNRFKFTASKGLKLGPTFLVARWVHSLTFNILLHYV